MVLTTLAQPDPSKTVEIEITRQTVCEKEVRRIGDRVFTSESEARLLVGMKKAVRVAAPAPVAEEADEETDAVTGDEEETEEDDGETADDESAPQAQAPRQRGGKRKGK